MQPIAEVMIPRRFCGPPTSANGGYACGVVARFLSGPAQIRLLAAPPLDQPLVIVADDPRIAMMQGDAKIAEASPATLELEVPPPLSFAEADAASRSSTATHPTNPYKTCFVCGPRDDGLRIYPGRVPERAIYAAPWIPDASVAGEDGSVRTEIMWSALDCPSGYAAGSQNLIVLGTLTGHLHAPVYPGERLITIGWPLGREGRKWFSGSAIYDEAGRRRGSARAVWIELNTAPPVSGGPPTARWT